MIARRLLMALCALFLLACEREAALEPGISAAAVDPSTAKTLLALSLPDLDGKPQSLRQWQGKIQVVNYWATWCPPCKEEMPGFSRLHDKYSANGVQFVGISIDSPDKVKKFQAEMPVSYPLLLGTMEIMQVTEQLGNPAQGLPFTVILDRQGEIHSTKLGRFSEEVLEQRLQTLLKQ